MKTLSQIDSELATARCALRCAVGECEAADAKNDETAYDAANADRLRIVAQIDALHDERRAVLFDAFSDQINIGGFACRFQPVVDVMGYWHVADTQTRRIVRSDISDKPSAQHVCNEMAHFTRTREAALKRQDRPIWNERNRTMRPA